MACGARGSVAWAAGVAVLLGLASAGWAHGGSYRIPPGEAPPAPGTRPGIPTSGGGGTVTPPDGGTPTPRGLAGGTPTRHWQDGEDSPREDLSPWEYWWLLHRDRYLLLRERLRGRDDPTTVATSGGGIGRTAGGGSSGNAVRPGKEPREVYREEVLPEILRFLRDPDPEVRSAATVALGRMGFVEAFPGLSKVRKDRKRDVRDGSVVGMGMLEDGIAVPELQTVLFDAGEDERSRGLAALALGLVGGRDAAEELLRFLADDREGAPGGGLRCGPETVAAAVVGLGLAGDRSVIPDLRRALVEGRRLDSTVRCRIPISLARLGDRESLPLLLQSLGFREAAMRQSGAVALGLLGRPGDAAVLAALARAAREDSDLHARTYSLMALAEIGGEGAVEALRGLLDTGKAVDRPVAVLALGVAGDREWGGRIQGIFAEEKNLDLRGAAATALGLLRRREAAPVLRKEAEGKKESPFRCHCLIALGMMEDPDAVEVAQRMLVVERDPEVGLAAALCLGLLRDRRTPAVIGEIARTARNVFTRGNACRLLGRIGDGDGARVLLAYAKDNDQHSVVRTCAVAALGVLAERGAVPILTRITMDANYATPVDPLREIELLL